MIQFAYYTYHNSALTTQKLHYYTKRSVWCEGE